jgi:hypothetical protein
MIKIIQKKLKTKYFFIFNTIYGIKIANKQKLRFFIFAIDIQKEINYYYQSFVPRIRDEGKGLLVLLPPRFWDERGKIKTDEPFSI